MNFSKLPREKQACTGEPQQGSVFNPVCIKKQVVNANNSVFYKIMVAWSVNIWLLLMFHSLESFGSWYVISGTEWKKSNNTNCIIQNYSAFNV